MPVLAHKINCRLLALLFLSACSGQSTPFNVAIITTENFQAQESIADVTFSTDTQICPIGASISVLNAGDFRFDLEEDGTLCGGASATLDAMFAPGAFDLRFENELFYLFGGHSFPKASGNLLEAVSEDLQEIALGPYSFQKDPFSESGPVEDSGVNVSRKIKVFSSAPIARYLEILTNDSTETKELSFTSRSFLTTSNDSKILTYDPLTSEPGKSSRFFAFKDEFGNRPTVGLVIQDSSTKEPLDTLFLPEIAGGEVDEVTFGWSTVSLAPGQSKTFIYYVLYSEQKIEDIVANKLLDISSAPNMDGLSIDELKNLANFRPRRGTLSAAATSVSPNIDVTAENLRSGESVSVKSLDDGSFYIPIDVQASDKLRLTTAEGTSFEVKAP